MAPPSGPPTSAPPGVSVAPPSGPPKSVPLQSKAVAARAPSKRLPPPPSSDPLQGNTSHTQHTLPQKDSVEEDESDSAQGDSADEASMDELDQEARERHQRKHQKMLQGGNMGVFKSPAAASIARGRGRGRGRGGRGGRKVSVDTSAAKSAPMAAPPSGAGSSAAKSAPMAAPPSGAVGGPRKVKAASSKDTKRSNTAVSRGAASVMALAGFSDSSDDEHSDSEPAPRMMRSATTAPRMAPRPPPRAAPGGSKQPPSTTAPPRSGPGKQQAKASGPSRRSHTVAAPGRTQAKLGASTVLALAGFGEDSSDDEHSDGGPTPVGGAPSPAPPKSETAPLPNRNGTFGSDSEASDWTAQSAEAAPVELPSPPSRQAATSAKPAQPPAGIRKLSVSFVTVSPDAAPPSTPEGSPTESPSEQRTGRRLSLWTSSAQSNSHRSSGVPRQESAPASMTSSPGVASPTHTQPAASHVQATAQDKPTTRARSSGIDPADALPVFGVQPAESQNTARENIPKLGAAIQRQGTQDIPSAPLHQQPSGELPGESSPPNAKSGGKAPSRFGRLSALSAKRKKQGLPMPDVGSALIAAAPVSTPSSPGVSSSRGEASEDASAILARQVAQHLASTLQARSAGSSRNSSRHSSPSRQQPGGSPIPGAVHVAVRGATASPPSSRTGSPLATPGESSFSKQHSALRHAVRAADASDSAGQPIQSGSLRSHSPPPSIAVAVRPAVGAVATGKLAAAPVAAMPSTLPMHSGLSSNRSSRDSSPQHAASQQLASPATGALHVSTLDASVIGSHGSDASQLSPALSAHSPEAASRGVMLQRGAGAASQHQSSPMRHAASPQHQAASPSRAPQPVLGGAGRLTRRQELLALLSDARVRRAELIGSLDELMAQSSSASLASEALQAKLGHASALVEQWSESVHSQHAELLHGLVAAARAVQAN